jgi:hypothetical protein
MSKSKAQSRSTVRRDGQPRQFSAAPMEGERGGCSLPCLSDELLIVCARVDFNP